FLAYFDPDDDMKKIDQWVYDEAPKEDIRAGTYNIFQLSQSPLHLSGPAFGPNYHRWMLKIKDAFDPNGLSNPPAPQHVDQLFNEAPWLKTRKNW
ncbi:MAG: hypothetical protein SV375_23355, partial [Thermodesulfobacteriota bacterium]|nr:hypothetical protein [Thermodesulfobacteriota bacterium]